MDLRETLQWEAIGGVLRMIWPDYVLARSHWLLGWIYPRGEKKTVAEGLAIVII